MKYEIQCGFCEDKFESSRANAQFCSDNCRVKNHQAKKKQEEAVKEEITIQQEEQDLQRNHLEQQRSDLIRANQTIAQRGKKAEDDLDYAKWVVRDIGKRIKFMELEITDFEARQKRLQSKIPTLRKRIAELNALVKKGDINLVFELKKIMQIRNIEAEIPQIEHEVEELYGKVSSHRKKLVQANSALEKWRDRLEIYKKGEQELWDLHEKNIQEIDAITNRLNRPNPTRTISLPTKPVLPKRIAVKSQTTYKDIGAGDLQNVNFQTFQLPGELGAFLGELDRNKTCFALTGDSGAGKSYFSFEIARLFITELGVRCKYFSLEEGVGKLTQEKVTMFGLGNELNLAAKGSLEDVRIAAKEYPFVIVDSFNSLGAKAEDFERLRTDFPNTMFLLIFQKTTAGTIRGGSAIKYNSSATIDVIKRDGERIAIMEKGRYGTIGWEYSISTGQVVSTGNAA